MKTAKQTVKKVFTFNQYGKTWKFVEQGEFKGKTLYQSYEESYDLFGNKFYAKRELVQNLPSTIEQEAA
jgi:hypothetical protein